MNDNDEEAIPCETCKRPTTLLETKRCNGCWEVERRLDEYLRRGGRRAQDFVAKSLTASDPRIMIGLMSPEKLS